MPKIEIPIVSADGHGRRTIVEAIECRMTDGTASISGYASVFNQETTIGGPFGFREQVAPGAFDAALTEDDVRALFNHNPDLLLGRTANKTLTLSVDDRGLRYAVTLPDTAAARDVQTLIKRGDVTGSSFGFKVLGDQWDERDVKKGGLPLRTITKVELFDVSPVTYPAYPQTSVSARSKAQAITETAESAKAATDGIIVGNVSTANHVAGNIIHTSVQEREDCRQAIEAAKAWRKA